MLGDAGDGLVMDVVGSGDLSMRAREAFFSSRCKA
jgi:hypothetical protein